MRIEKLKIKSFRTITKEQEVSIDKEITLVGPNNAGKTNTLLAFKAFFTGYDNSYNYSLENDAPFYEKNTRTSLTCFFILDDGDNERYDELMKLRELLKIDENEKSFFINLYFSPSSKPIYQLYPGISRPKDATEKAKFSISQKKFIISILDTFQWYYIPSNKSIKELYDNFITPFIRKKIAKVLDSYDFEIKESIATLTDSMNKVLLDIGIDNIETSMEYPNNNIEKFISGLDLYVKDESSTSIFQKGMGIQAVVLLSAFKWITEEQKDKHVLWLIEEPETFLHPNLADKCSKLLESLTEISTVIKTTHALNFIPSNIKNIQGVELNKDGNTIIKRYLTHKDATDKIRTSLGVKFSDFFSLSNKNIFLEGETDRMYMEYIFDKFSTELIDIFPTLLEKDVLFKDFTGVSDMKGFLKANYALMKDEVAIVSLFDGDDAGDKSVRELAGYFRNKGGYNSNKDYVLIPNKMAIESLFPDEWIKEAYENEEVWFEHYQVDAGDVISFFDIRDKSKKAYMEYMFRKIDESQDLEWLNKFKVVFGALNKALELQIK